MSLPLEHEDIHLVSLDTDATPLLLVDRDIPVNVPMRGYSTIPLRLVQTLLGPDGPTDSKMTRASSGNGADPTMREESNIPSSLVNDTILPKEGLVLCPT